MGRDRRSYKKNSDLIPVRLKAAGYASGELDLVQTYISENKRGSVDTGPTTQDKNKHF